MADEIGLRGGINVADGRAPSPAGCEEVAVMMVVLEQVDFIGLDLHPQ